MRIAQVAPLFESVPPANYGGTERIVSYLTEELVLHGHDVTLFASGDSKTRARLFSPCPRSLRTDPSCHDPIALHIVMIEQVLRRAHEFDVLHFHIDHLHFPAVRRTPVRTVTTLHGRLDLPELPSIFRSFPEIPLVSISDAQRTPVRWANWVRTVYHGLPRDLYCFDPAPEPYLAFIGRISPEKGIEPAIEIATRAGIPLRIAAKIDRADRDYFEARVRRLLDHRLVHFEGEIGDAQKQHFLGKASALLFPIDWPEPFGLVMIEAMACGTPVVAFRRGSVAEIVESGVNGVIVDSVADAVGAVRDIGSIPRRCCRESFEQRFSASRMMREYLAVYQSLGSPDTHPPADSETVEVRQCR